MIEGMIGIAVFTENATLYDRAVGYWRQRVPSYLYHWPSDGGTPKPAPRTPLPSWFGQVCAAHSTTAASATHRHPPTPSPTYLPTHPPFQPLHPSTRLCV